MTKKTNDSMDDAKKTIESGDDKKKNDSRDDAKKTIESGDDKKEEWTYNQGWMSNSGKKRLNRQMRDLVRPVHVSALAYTLPDKTKKCCMTWREAISLHEEKTGKCPNWSAQFLQCKLCGKYFTTERNFESTTPGVTST